MKTVLSKLTLSYLFAILGTTTLIGQQNLISLNADRYYVQLNNHTDYHIIVKFGTSKEKLIDPYDHTIIQGNFNKSTISRKKITCVYNETTYKKDKAANENEFSSAKQNARYARKNREDNNYDDLRNKILAEIASTASTDSDNWFFQGLTWVVRKGGQAVKGIYGFKELMEQIDANRFKNYRELFQEFFINRYKDAKVKQVSRLIDRHIGLEKETSEYVIKSALYYLAQSDKIEEDYVNRLEQIEANYEARLSDINNLLADPYFSSKHTYKGKEIITGESDFSTKTPNVTLAIEPLFFGNSLNQHWEAAPEQVLVQTGPDQYKFGNAFHDTSIGGSFKIAVSPEMSLSEDKNLFSRLYVGAAYYRTGYQLKGLDYSLSTSFFQISPPTSPGFTLSRPMRYEQIDIAGELSWRFFLGKVFTFDLNGGYAKQSGTLHLKHSELSQGYSWTSDWLPITNEEYKPYFGAKLGIGKSDFTRQKALKGIQLTGGVQFMQPQLRNTTSYQFVESSTDRAIGFGSNGEWVYRIFIGVGISF